MKPIIGSACILQHGEVLLFELQKQHKWRYGADGTPTIGLGCIGGRLERDESAQQALQREACEEIGCRVELRRPDKRVFIGPDLSARRLDPGEDDPLAALYWEATGSGFIPGARVAVYLGTAIGEPRPADLPAVLCLPKPVLSMLWSGGNVEHFIRAGCWLLEREPIPRDALLEPAGTVAVLAQLHRPSPDIVEWLLEGGLTE